MNQPGSFGYSERRKFYFEMAKCFLDKGWLELWLLELNGVPSAAPYSRPWSNRTCISVRDSQGECRSSGIPVQSGGVFLGHGLLGRAPASVHGSIDGLPNGVCGGRFGNGVLSTKLGPAFSYSALLARDSLKTEIRTKGPFEI